MDTIRINLGRRILICGPSGSGKTTLMGQLSAILNLPGIEFDQLRHRIDGSPRSDQAFRNAVKQAFDANPDAWMACAVVPSPEVLSIAESILWLTPPKPVVYWRILRRKLRLVSFRRILPGTRGGLRIQAVLRAISEVRRQLAGVWPHEQVLRRSLVANAQPQAPVYRFC